MSGPESHGGHKPEDPREFQLFKLFGGLLSLAVLFVISGGAAANGKQSKDGPSQHGGHKAH